MLSQATRATVLSILADAIDDPRLDEFAVSAKALAAAREFVLLWGTAPVRVDARDDRAVIGTTRGTRLPDRLEIRRFAVLLAMRDDALVSALARNADQHARAGQA